ncbi:MAG: DUF4070 domain-containing protein [Desulfatitalea sp.]|nr:DUF4070 domain-containing protein [Desulfatitalea sp.]NNJ98890.1 DUF4070 domain-containing protein [Desulfatitalea sp.]
MDAPFHVPDVWRELRELPVTRKVLFVCPQFPVTYWSWHFSIRDLLGFNRRSYAPPLDLLTVAAFFPDHWPMRLVDENIHALTDEDLAWADVVVTVANRVQMESLERIIHRAHELGKPVVLGGLDPSMRPHYYDTVDYLHAGLIGDATRDLLLALAQNAARPAERQVFTVQQELHISDYPPPRYELIDTGEYLAVSLQFAVGCPFKCEFCEVAPYYGRQPRVKTPDQVLHELDKLYAMGYRGVVVFVDDNFVGNLSAAKQTIELLLRWQQSHGHPFQFFASASANLAERPDVMDLMSACGFFCVFVGIETPNAKDLKAIQKTQNIFTSTLEIVATIQRHGIQVYGAFILGFDTEGADAGDNIVDFVESAAICTPILSLMTASQGTALYNRLLAEGRLVTQTQKGPFIDSNVVYQKGQTEVFRQYVDTYNRLYDPRAFFRRLRRNMQTCKIDDKQYGKSLPFHLRLKALPRMIWHMGIKPSWRWSFWRVFLFSIANKTFNYFGYMAFMGYHYIHFSKALSANPPLAVTAELLPTSAQPGSNADSPLDYARVKDGPMVYHESC